MRDTLIGGHARIVRRSSAATVVIASVAASDAGNRNRADPSLHSFFLMQSTVEALDGNKVKLHVTVPADEFERAIDGAFKKLAREVRVPGFRPGKAPRQLLEARFGTDIGAGAGAARLAARVLRRSRRGRTTST